MNQAWHWRQGSAVNPGAAVHVEDNRGSERAAVANRRKWCAWFTRGIKIRLGDNSSVLGWETRATRQVHVLWEDEHPSFDSCCDWHLKRGPQTHPLSMHCRDDGTACGRLWDLLEVKLGSFLLSGSPCCEGLCHTFPHLLLGPPLSQWDRRKSETTSPRSVFLPYVFVSNILVTGTQKHLIKFSVLLQRLSPLLVF